MNTSVINAVRAIGAEQIQRLLKIIACIVIVITVMIVVALNWASSSFSEWWWIFLVPLTIVDTLIILIVAVFWAISFLIMPRTLTRSEHKQIKRFIDHLFVATSNTQLSRFTLAYLMIKDALQGKKFSNRVQLIVGEGKGLQEEFVAITKLF